MKDQVRIEQSNGNFTVMLEQFGMSHEMDRRSTIEDAKDYAFYLANSVSLDVYYEGKKISSVGGG